MKKELLAIGSILGAFGANAIPISRNTGTPYGQVKRENKALIGADRVQRSSVNFIQKSAVCRAKRDTSETQPGISCHFEKLTL